MPRGNRNVLQLAPPRDSWWRCPCGYTATWAVVCGHRNGYLARRACHGNLRRLDAPNGAVPDGPRGDSLNPRKAEEIVRRLNRAREAACARERRPTLPSTAPSSPQSPKHPSLAHMLPDYISAYYEYAKRQGWPEGEGSFAFFVTAALVDHYHNCCGVSVVRVGDDGSGKTTFVVSQGDRPRGIT